MLQTAFVKGLERGGELRDDESAVAWFYRLLRNALVDFYRRRAVESRVLQRHAAEVDEVYEHELESVVCGCIAELVPTLKPEYAEILRSVDLGGETLGAFAARAGITVNNATVRAHRARLALKRQLQRLCGTCTTHGCLDCSCPTAPAGH